MMAYTRSVLGLDLRQSRNGLLICIVQADSLAGRVGIKSGDLVAKVAGYELEILDQFRKLMGQMHWR